jgi:dipeptidyl aminopeptidase/acylaminoacyl peptidase
LAFEDYSQPLPVQEEDYATARAEFETTLTIRGPAPQDWDQLETPNGAAELIYHSGGHALRAFVDPPPSDGQPRPGVVFLHNGYAWGESDWEMSQPYRDQGYVVMSPVLRGENGQPGDFSLYYDEVDDILAATSAFAALPYVDETQLYISGHSSGGTLASLAALTTDRFLAMASFSGSMNQEGVDDWEYPDKLVYNEFNLRETLMRSPEAFAKSFKCPARLYYGSDEDWFPEETDRTAATAQKAGLDVQAIMVPGDHYTSVHPAMRRSITFFRQIGDTNGKQPSTSPSNDPPRSAPPEVSYPDFSIPDLPDA